MSTHKPQTHSTFHRLGPVRIARLWAFCALACASLGACVDSGGSDMATDTKTNWLDTCDKSSDCSDGLSCLCGVCTRECDDNEACSALGSSAECGSVSGCGDNEQVCTAPPAAGADDATESDEPSSETSDSSAEGEPEESDDEAEPSEPNEPATEGEVPGDPGTQPEGEGEVPAEPGDDPVSSDDDSSAAGGEADAGGEPESDAGVPTADAGSECPRPKDEYSLFGEECFLADFACAGYFMDECGCGCDDETSEEPPSGSMCGHSAEEYVGDPEQCQVIKFACADDETMFSNDCGCGCAPLDSCDIPGRDYVANSPNECAAVLFMCVDDTTMFFDECGCGCQHDVDGGALACEDESRVYASHDPEECQLLDLNCDGAVFTDDCGCGCIEQAPPSEK